MERKSESLDRRFYYPPCSSCSLSARQSSPSLPLEIAAAVDGPVRVEPDRFMGRVDHGVRGVGQRLQGPLPPAVYIWPDRPGSSPPSASAMARPTRSTVLRTWAAGLRGMGVDRCSDALVGKVAV